MRKRLKCLIMSLILFTSCQPVVPAEEPIVVPAMTSHPVTIEPISQSVETSQSLTELYPPPPPPEDRYPAEGVRGIYLSAYGAVSPDFSNHAKELIRTTGLNAVVIDYKDDYGHIVSTHTSSDPVLQSAVREVYSAADMIEGYHQAGAYTIARIVCFKDAYRSQAEPASAMQNPDGSVFIAPTGDAYLNPFDKANWDYLVAASIEAAKAGFDEIQFDYVRFPESFNTLAASVVLDQGDYAELDMSEEEKRSQVIADFIGYAREKLAPYHVRLSVDIFGYVAMTVDDGNVGQNFLKICQNVDVISSMIYPSHWSDGSFGADKPDTQPGLVVGGYITRELELLSTLESPPVTRPWLQSFTASYLGAGNYIDYGPAEIEAQIEALRHAGVFEYLLWDPSNNYFTNVNY